MRVLSDAETLFVHGGDGETPPPPVSIEGPFEIEDPYPLPFPTEELL